MPYKKLSQLFSRTSSVTQKTCVHVYNTTEGTAVNAIPQLLVLKSIQVNNTERYPFLICFLAACAQKAKHT